MLEHRRVARARLVDQQDRRIEQFGGIVRRDAGRHADRDAARAIGEQIGEEAGEQLGFLLFAIIGRPVIDGVLVEAVHHVDRDLGQPCLGVAIGRRVIAVDITEIALSVDERIAHRKALREPDHRVIDRLVAMRVVFADYVADDARAFLVALRRIEPEQAHRP